MSHNDTCILFDDGPNIPLAEAVVERALIKLLGAGFKGAPWNCRVIPESTNAKNGHVTGHHWLLHTTADEWAKLKDAIAEEFEADGGWSEVPVVCSHLLYFS